jgi:Family of unknown function (DUF6074)
MHAAMKPAGAVLLAFPLAKRHALVKKLAAQMLAREPSEAETHLGVELRRHGRVLLRRQFSKATVQTQLRSLERSVRAKLWQLVMLPPTTDQGGGS